MHKAAQKTGELQGSETNFDFRVALQFAMALLDRRYFASISKSSKLAIHDRQTATFERY